MGGFKKKKKNVLLWAIVGDFSPPMAQPSFNFPFCHIYACAMFDFNSEDKFFFLKYKLCLFNISSYFYIYSIKTNQNFQIPSYRN